MDKDQQDDSTGESLTVEQAGENLASLFGDSELFEDTSEERTPQDKDEAEAASGDEGDVPAKDADGEDSAEAGEGDQTPAVRVFKDSRGNEYELPTELHEEIEKGTLRQSDYTKKTQELAERRRAIESETAQAKQERAEVAATLTKLRQIVETQMPAEPDWQKLAAENPEAFPETFARWKSMADRLAKVQAAEEEAAARVHADLQKELEVRMQEEAEKLAAALPAWADPKQGPVARQRLVSYAEKIGYTPQQLGQVRDHRLIVLLDKARQFDELKATAAKPGAVPAKKVAARITLKPGSSQDSKPKVTDAARANMRLAKTGSAEDAAAAFLASGIL